MNVWIGNYSEFAREIRQIRHQVFVQGMNVSPDLEFEGDDDNFTHVLVFLNEEPVGTGRIDDVGHFGRIAVQASARSQGVGRAVMQALENHARDSGVIRLWAHAQISAMGFYEKLGYQPSGPEFIEAGIRHRLIEKRF